MLRQARPGRGPACSFPSAAKLPPCPLCHPGTSPLQSLPRPQTQGRPCSRWSRCSAGDVRLPAGQEELHCAAAGAARCLFLWVFVSHNSCSRQQPRQSRQPPWDSHRMSCPWFWLLQGRAIPCRVPRDQPAAAARGKRLPGERAVPPAWPARCAKTPRISVSPCWPEPVPVLKEGGSRCAQRSESL